VHVYLINSATESGSHMCCCGCPYHCDILPSPHCWLLLIMFVLMCQVMVPSVLESLLPALAPGGTWALSQLRVMVLSGEPLTWQLARTLLQLLPPSCSSFNLYGEAGAVTWGTVQLTCMFFIVTCHQARSQQLP
jgi:hypothetical protein